MSDAQENHLDEIKTKFRILVDAKYRKGQLEHGGDLFEKDGVKLLDCAIDEVIDLVVYLFTLRAKITARRENNG